MTSFRSFPCRRGDSAPGWERELGRSPEWREQLIAEVDGRAVGFVQIIDPAHEESRYWGEVDANLRAIDLWIGDAADLGRGYGTRMMAPRRFGNDECFVYRLERSGYTGQ